MKYRDWVWVAILVTSQIVMWRIYSVAYERQARHFRRQLEELSRRLEWVEANRRIL